MSVAIVMGSDSDEPVMRLAADALEEFGISWEMRVISAHRTPDIAVEFASGCTRPRRPGRSSPVRAARRTFPACSRP